MATIEEILMQLQKEAFSGALAKASTETLEEYAAALCHSQAFTAFGDRQFPQICETVRVHLLRAHIGVLQKHITALDAKNTMLSWLVVALTVASLIGSASQIWYAYKADKRVETETKSIAAQQQQNIQPATTAFSALPDCKFVSPK